MTKKYFGDIVRGLFFVLLFMKSAKEMFKLFKPVLNMVCTVCTSYFLCRSFCISKVFLWEQAFNAARILTISKDAIHGWIVKVPLHIAQNGAPY